MHLKIKKLFNEKDIEIDLDKKMNVLIGSNGSGKSTILKIIKCLLSNNLIELSEIEFEEVTLEIGKDEIEIYELKDGNESVKDRLICNVKRKDIIPLKYVQDAKFRIIFKEFLEEYNYLEDINNKRLNFDKFISEFEEKYENNKSGVNIEYSKQIEFDEDEKYFLSSLQKLNPKYTLESIKSLYKSLLNEYRYGCKLYFYNLYLLSIRINILNILNIEDNIDINKVFIDEEKILEGLNIGDTFFKCSITNILSRGKELISRFYNPIWINWNSRYKIIYREFSFINSDLNGLLFENFNKELMILSGLFNRVEYDDYVIYKEKIKYDKGLLTLKSFNNLIRNISVEPSDDLGATDDLKVLTKILKSDMDKIKHIINIISFYKDKLKVIDKTKEDYSKVLFNLKNKGKKFFKIFDPIKKMSREDYIVLNLEKDDYILNLMEGKIISIDNLENSTLREIFSLDKIFENMEKINIIDYLDSECSKVFYTLSKKYFHNKKFVLRHDGEECIAVDIYDAKSNHKLTEDMLSSGEYKMLRIIKRIAFSDNNDIYFLDEPELSLSVFWQKMILDDILKYGNQKMIIVATQSPYLLDEDKIKYLVEVPESE